MRTPLPPPTPAGTGAQPLAWSALARALAQDPLSVRHTWQWLTLCWNQEDAACADRVVVCGPAAASVVAGAPAAWTALVDGWDPLGDVALPQRAAVEAVASALLAGGWALYLDPGLVAGVVGGPGTTAADEATAYTALDTWLQTLASAVPEGVGVVLQIPTTESVALDRPEDSFGTVTDQVVHRRQRGVDGGARWDVTWQMLQDRVLYRVTHRLVVRSAWQWQQALDAAGWTLSRAGVRVVPRSEEVAGCSTAVLVARRRANPA